jgi:AraC-like DNA-binding protein
VRGFWHLLSSGRTPVRALRPLDYDFHSIMEPFWNACERIGQFQIVMRHGPLPLVSRCMLQETWTHCHDRTGACLISAPSPPLSAEVAACAVDGSAERAHISEVVRRLLSQANRPTLTLVAQRLCITPRTLQRRLRKSGSTFRALLADVRLELATEQLHKLHTVAASAEVAGFSEPSCFHRAFKRWTGETPKRFPRKNTMPPPVDAGAHCGD